MQLRTQQDVDPQALSGRTIAVVGYGSQGRAHALNLRDSGYQVLIGARANGASQQRASADGFEVLSPEQATARADLVALLTPDMAQAEVFEQIRSGLKAGDTLLFAHGFNVHFGQIEVPPDIDVVLVAPKGPGDLVRREYVDGHGVPCLLATHQDASGHADARALAYADGIGGTRGGVLDTTFAEETETDLFGEQAVLCGGVSELIVKGYETLVEAGYQPQVAYFECLHELKLIVDLLHEGGLAKMHRFISETAQYGDLVSGPKVVDEQVRERMREVLADITSGRFAEAWVAEHRSGRGNYQRLMQADLDHPIEAVGRALRERMPWLQADQSAQSDDDAQAA